MSRPPPFDKLQSDELSLHSIDVSEEVDSLYPVSVTAEFRGVEKSFERVLLTKILNSLPILLAALDEHDMEMRLRHLCRSFQLDDWRANSDSDMIQNGNASIEWFFRSVPLLSEAEVLERLPSNISPALSELMQVKYDGHTFYFADQFAVDGSVHQECIDCWRILKSNLSEREWERALWWIYETGWLEGQSAPREVFKENSEGVQNAAKQWAIRDEH